MSWGWGQEKDLTPGIGKSGSGQILMQTDLLSSGGHFLCRVSIHSSLCGSWDPDEYMTQPLPSKGSLLLFLPPKSFTKIS